MNATKMSKKELTALTVETLNLLRNVWHVLDYHDFASGHDEEFHDLMSRLPDAVQESFYKNKTIQARDLDPPQKT